MNNEQEPQPASPEDTSTARRIKLRSHEEALSELQREFNVRDRCYDGWIKLGKLSTVDARDRMERLATAIQILKHLEAASTDASA